MVQKKNLSTAFGFVDDLESKLFPSGPEQKQSNKREH